MNITIPPAALEAAAVVLMSRLMVSREDALHVWSGMYEPEKEQFRREARAACIAMLRNWPGMELDEAMWSGGISFIVLPLTQENSDEPK